MLLQPDSIPTPALGFVPGGPGDSRDFTIEITPGTTAWGEVKPAATTWKPPELSKLKR